MAKLPSSASFNRRDFLLSAGTAAAAAGLAGSSAASTQPASGGAAPAAAAAANGPYNILFILVDQERLFRPGELPADFSLPAHERLTKQGTTFVNHTINSCVCTPSRSVIYTGQHIQ